MESCIFVCFCLACFNWHDVFQVHLLIENDEISAFLRLTTMPSHCVCVCDVFMSMCPQPHFIHSSVRLLLLFVKCSFEKLSWKVNIENIEKSNRVTHVWFLISDIHAWIIWMSLRWNFSVSGLDSHSSQIHLSTCLLGSYNYVSLDCMLEG